MEKEVVKRLKAVFGIHSISIAHLANSTIEDITAKAIEVCKNKGSFRVTVNRADKTFPLTSLETAQTLGGKLLEAYPNLTVDLQLIFSNQ